MTGPDSASLMALAERCEAASDGSHELTRDIIAALRLEDAARDHFLWCPCTDSLDAAVALCGQILPGEQWCVAGGGPGRSFARFAPANHSAWATTPALALTAAVLRALAANNPTGERDADR